MNEKREFTSWSDVAPEVDEASYVTTSNGIIEGKRALNRLHAWMGEEGYNQVHKVPMAMMPPYTRFSFFCRFSSIK